MSNFVEIAGLKIGPDYPPVLVAELGLNYALGPKGQFLDNVLNMIRLAKLSGASLVKFQKRTPRICVPQDQWDKLRSTPWGDRSYIDYKEDIELDAAAYDTINAVCKEEGIPWFASVWDEPSVDFMEAYDPPCYKIGSASLTDRALIHRALQTGRPLIVSTGMSTWAEIHDAVYVDIGVQHLDYVVLCHSTSIYPCPLEKLNLQFIRTLQEICPRIVIGYSGHERGNRVTQAAVALGASYIERHFTLDRRGWGTDQAASLEHWQFKDMADRCMETWQALGSGVKEVYPEEEEKRAQLRVVV